MTDDNALSLFISSETLPTRSLLADLFHEFHRIPYEDAAQMAKHSWGFLGENMAADETARMADVASSQHMETRSIPSVQERSIQSEPPRHTAQVRFDDKQLTFIHDDTTSAEWSWEQVRILSAAPLKEESVSVQTIQQGPSAGARAAGLAVTALTGIPLNFGGRKKEIKKETVRTELIFVMDVLAGPDLRRWSLRSDDLDFSCLGSEKTYSSQTNFRILLLRWAERSSTALKNSGVHAFRNNRPLYELGYETAADYEKELRRLLVLDSLNNV
ncbi:MAG TPA: hypothetical protein PK876_00190 [Elusimicrobiota bacterium]|nr:hypothetical protein [Elusimicrobiota bacterium]